MHFLPSASPHNPCAQRIAENGFGCRLFPPSSSSGNLSLSQHFWGTQSSPLHQPQAPRSTAPTRTPAPALCCPLPAPSAGPRRAHARAHAGVPGPACHSARAHRVRAVPKTEEAGKPAEAGRWLAVRPVKELPGVRALQVWNLRHLLPPGRLRWARSALFAKGRDLSPPPGFGSGGGWGIFEACY